MRAFGLTRFSVRAVGGISLKVSPSSTCALIKGWVGAKARASSSHCAGNGGKAEGGCVGGGGGWHQEQPFSMMETSSLLGMELQRGRSPCRAPTRPQFHLLSW